MAVVREQSILGARSICDHVLSIDRLSEVGRYSRVWLL